MDALSYIRKLFGDADPEADELPAGGPGAIPPSDPYKFAKIRNALPQSGSDSFQQIAAPLEHREFVEGFVAEHPLIGPPAAAVSTLGYYAKKKLTPEGLRSADETPASIDQVFAAFQGIGRGIKANFAGGAVPPKSKPIVTAGDMNTQGILT